ncbi:MAG: radical SAM protein, partial [Flavobacteriales bacterium]|nr:radical SAM protein [Flavobacteriales bacterium]
MKDNHMHTQKLNGRGAQTNPHNRFLKGELEVDPEFLEYCDLEGDEPESNRTQYIPIHPKTIITKNSSPDVPFDWSINPYQGCEHGCVYCYARNSHEYWG